MKKTPLQLCRAAAINKATSLRSTKMDPDVIEKVIAYVAESFPDPYGAAVVKSGAGVVHSQLAKAVKGTLRAQNLGRKGSSDDAPCNTHTQLIVTK